MGFPTIGQNTVIRGSGAIHYALITSGVVSDAKIFAGGIQDLTFNWTLEEEELLSPTEGPSVIVANDVTRTELLLTGNAIEHRKENFERWLMATSGAANQTIGASTEVEFADVVLDRYYDTGVLRGTNVVVAIDESGGATLVSGTDYRYDFQTGFLHILTGGTVVAGDDLIVTLDKPALTINSMALGQSTQQEVRVWFSTELKNISAPSQYDLYMFPKAIIRPNGEMNVISDGRWVLPIQFKVIADTTNFPSSPYGTMKRISA